MNQSLQPFEDSVYQHIVLVHYHEVGLKGRNRSYFESLLLNNIEKRLTGLVNFGFRLKRVSGRILITLTGGRDTTPAQAAARAAQIVAQIPGVVRVSTGLRLPQDLELVEQTALHICTSLEPFASFRVTARRANTDYPIESMQINNLVGAWLKERLPDKKVQMRDPDVTVHIEMVEGSAFVYAITQPGVGGLPVGSAGKVVSLLSSGIDSPVATWRLLRRGAEVCGLHFSGRPETADTSEHLVKQIAECLEPYGGLYRLAVVPFGSYQRQIAAAVPAPLRVIMYRRMMFAVAESLATGEGAKALVTGESLGQVASQTLENILAVNAVVSLPVLRPLIGMDKLEIIAEAERIGTYPISSQAHDDCCTLFIPRNPATRASLKMVQAIWDELPIDQWLQGIMSEMEFVI